MEITTHEIHLTDTVAKITILLWVVGRIILLYIFYNQVRFTDSFIKSFPILPYTTGQRIRVPGTVIEVIRNVSLYVSSFTFVRNGTVAEVLEEHQRTVCFLCSRIYVGNQSVHFFVTGKNVRFRNIIIIVPIQVIAT